MKASVSQSVENSEILKFHRNLLERFGSIFRLGYDHQAVLKEKWDCFLVILKDKKIQVSMITTTQYCMTCVHHNALIGDDWCW